jgi:type II secretory ATPase GspE/PulE/Tfp pilus assembly ATPase PilB-like protein
MVAATIEGILAQRLIRRICTNCRERYRPEPEVVALLAGKPVSMDASLTFERGSGCAACRQTGYRGRAGIFELLPLTDDIRQLLTEAPDLDRIRRCARECGMQTLKQDGWAKVQAGVTTVEEVLRVVQT